MANQFAGGFRRRVRRDRLANRIVFAERNFRVAAVDRRRRAEHKLFDAVLAREFEQVYGAVDVGLRVELGFGERWAHAGAGSEMNDAIEMVFFEDVVECGAIANVSLYEFVSRIFEVFANVLAFDVGVIEVVEIIDNDDLIDAGSQQSIDEMRADKSGTPGNQKIFHDYFVA